jgi:uncharacterized protein DUF4112
VEAAQRVARVRRVAVLWDAALRIPGTPFAIGLDPILGLAPGLGDALGAAAALWIVLEAARLGAPVSTLSRMLANVAIDTMIGAVPVAGDVFDFAWKANLRNVELLERHVADPRAARRANTLWLGSIGVTLGAVLAGVVALGVVALRAVLRIL